MKLCYWQGKIPNFGDDLNPWLWSRLIPDFFDEDESTLFIGMGSILYHDYRADAKKLVFGSGYGGYTQPPAIDDRWKIYFVRGPLTADVLKVHRRFGIGDPATLVGCLPEIAHLPRAISGPAFMPHWESTIDGSWESVANRVGVRFIDPRWPVERVLAQIASSTLLVTEAMHGAIVADALRVPWIPLSPLGRHRFKWYDWAQSLNVQLIFAKSAPSTLLEAFLRCFNANPAMQTRLLFHGRKHDLSFANQFFERWAISALSEALRAPPNLSTDAAIISAWDAMQEKIECLRYDERPEVDTPEYRIANRASE